MSTPTAQEDPKSNDATPQKRRNRSLQAVIALSITALVTMCFLWATSMLSVFTGSKDQASRPRGSNAQSCPPGQTYNVSANAGVGSCETRPGASSLQHECEAGLRADWDDGGGEVVLPDSCSLLTSPEQQSIIDRFAAEKGLDNFQPRTATEASAEAAEMAADETVAPPEPELTQSAPSNFIAGDGTYLVGEDVKPGVYTAEAYSQCYWARLSSTDGEMGSIIANSLSKGRQTVTIKKSDEAFESRDCGPWTRKAAS